MPPMGSKKPPAIFFVVNEGNCAFLDELEPSGQSFGLNCFSKDIYSDMFVRALGFIMGAHSKQEELMWLSFIDNIAQLP